MHRVDGNRKRCRTQTGVMGYTIRRIRSLAELDAGTSLPLDASGRVPALL